MALSDYGLTLESAILAMLTHRRNERTRLRGWVVLSCAASAMASLAGGTVHGFTANPGSRGHRILWPASLISVGVAGLAGTMIGTILAFPPRTFARVSPALQRQTGSCYVFVEPKTARSRRTVTLPWERVAPCPLIAGARSRISSRQDRSGAIRA